MEELRIEQVLDLVRDGVGGVIYNNTKVRLGKLLKHARLTSQIRTRLVGRRGCGR